PRSRRGRRSPVRQRGGASWRWPRPRLLADEELRELILPALRADYTAIETHTPDPAARVDCPITVFTGDRDPQLPVSDARAWSAHTSGRCDLRVFPGAHFYLSDHPRDVAAAVGDAVAAIRRA
ncbi:thioesterase II family protein, partial [Marinitenerispora sediminis]|uniref:thioesterase II family protein n=1 Tax=Marinitenerispora sediminis TaxID=1931232 RepID=UPI000DFB7E9A